MKKTIRLISTILIIAVLCSLFVIKLGIEASADSGGYTIKSLDFKGVVHENNSVSVTETLNVNFYEQRHGIYRAIPLTMYVGGKVADLDDTLLYRNYVTDVNVDGYNFDVEEEDDYCYIKIGSEDKYVDGNQKYEISYTYTMPDDRLDTTDFLFYSVLGDKTGTAINNFKFNVKFDKALPEKSRNNLKIFSGSGGTEENSLGVEYKVSEKSISGEANDIPPYCAVTLFTKLKQGYFTGTKTVSPIPMLIFLTLLLLAVLVTIVLALKTKHYEPVQTVEFYPPDGISSAEVGTIIDEKVDDIDLMSLIPWWAQKGYITIEETGEKRKKHLILHKKNELPQNAPDYQKNLFSAFFAESSDCDLRDLKLSFAKRFTSAKDALNGLYSGEKSLSVGYGKAILMTVLISISLFLSLAFSSVISTFENLILAVFATLPVFLFGLMTTYGLRKGFKKLSGKILYGFISIVLFAISIALTYSCSINCVLPMYLPFIALGLATAGIIFSTRIIADTEYRVQMLGKLLGLKNFIETAELDRLRMMTEENPYYYYDILPYAMVFGLVDKWAKAFTNIKVDVPYWYTRYDTMTVWELMYLNRMLTTEIHEPISRINSQTAAKAMASASTSSSGGFSGGGGGGGGFGSW